MVTKKTTTSKKQSTPASSVAIAARGRELTGTVVSVKMRKSAVVEWERRHYLKKFERYEKRMSRVIVHVPEELTVEEGDIVRIKECRPLSKLKHFVVISNEGKERGYQIKKEGREGAKQEKPVPKEPEEEQ